jgi:hypothetical protein
MQAKLFGLLKSYSKIIFCFENRFLTGLKQCSDFLKIAESGLIGFEANLQKIQNKSEIRKKNRKRKEERPRGNFSAQSRKEPTAQLRADPESVCLQSLTRRPHASVAFYLRPGVQDEPDSLCAVHRRPSRETLAPSSSNPAYK